MSGLPSWASTEPSTNSTIEWITDCGWITTSSRSDGRPKRWCASISSRPLFISVAESTEIFAPIDQFGWATACDGVAAAIAFGRGGPERPAARGQHDL